MPQPAAKAMPAYSLSAQAALLKAVNRVFELDRAVESLEELCTGVTLAHILHELDPEFDPSNLETTGTSTSRYLKNKRNIQTVYKGLFRFIRRQIPMLSCQAKKYDYHAIADNPNSQGMSQLIAVMVSAAALGPDNQRYVPRIQHSLDRDTQAEIMQIITIVQQDIAASKDDDDLDEAIDAVMEARDIDLLVEEQNAALRQQLDVTKKNLSDYITRLEHLQLSHEELRYEKEKNDRELEVLRKATQDGASNAEALKMLEAQVHEQMEIIARNEEQIRNHDKVRAHLEMEVQRLTQRSVLADELRDQATEWKHKAEELEKKANTAERYKQKLESQQHLVREVQNLQYERAELQEQLRSLTDDKDRSARTRKAEDELTKMITQSEQHLWDERNQKSQLIRDVAALEDELRHLKDQRSHDEAFIQDLQDQIQQGTGIPGQLVAPDSSGLNLEDELNNAAEDAQTNIPLELSRLKSENDLLRRSVNSTGEAGPLRRELEEEKAHRENLQKNFNEMFEKYTIAHNHAEALSKNMVGEGSDAFIELRNQYLQKTEGLEMAQRRIAELETHIADQSRQLLTAKSELSAVDKDSVEALNQLRATDTTVSESLKAELDRLREKHSFIVGERDAQKTQLIEALLAKDKFRRDLEEGRDLSDSRGGDASEASKKESDKVEKLRARLIERNEQLEKSEQERVELQRKLKAVLGGEAAAQQKAASEQIIKNLERENSLMATAWYDVTSRLQSNHVVLQRSHHTPKSWLHKQRQMVNATPRR